MCGNRANACGFCMKVSRHVHWFQDLFYVFSPVIIYQCCGIASANTLTIVFKHLSAYCAGLNIIYKLKLSFLQSFGFSITAAVAEMLMQSTLNDLYLLPAIPLDKWENGCVKGLKARGGMTVNINWKDSDLHEVHLWSKDQDSLKNLHYRGTRVTVNISSSRIYTFNRQLQCICTSSLTEVI